MAKRRKKKPVSGQSVMLEVAPATAADVQSLGQSLIAESFHVYQLAKATSAVSVQQYIAAQQRYFAIAQKMSVIAASHPDLFEMVQSFFLKAQAVLQRSNG